MSASLDHLSLSARALDILRAVVSDHIATGEPVASQPLLARHELDCSAATVRHVMADLEALGFLDKPHSSSGRVPTERGYRLYVDALVKMEAPSRPERTRIELVAQQAGGTEDLLETAAGLLHSLSHHAAAVTTPRPEVDPLKRVEFVRLRENRALAVFISEAGLVQNRLLQLGFAMATADLERAANYLNAKLSEVSVAGLREAILMDMRADKSAFEALVQGALILAEQTYGETPSVSALVMDGEASLLDAPEFADIHKARELLRAFAEKDRVLRVLDKAMAARELSIFIGAESDFAGASQLLSDVAVIAAPYGNGERVLGTLAVIGPSRMNYARVIPLVDLTAREVTRSLIGQ